MTLVSGSGKTALVTGGTDGIGKEVARALAGAGHHVAVVGRDADKGSRAERELRATTANPDVWFLQADLSLVREANRVADDAARLWPALHYLVHSAGVVRGRREVTAEGVESNFATNYLSRFVLTQRLLPRLEAAGRPEEAARVVIVSGAARNGTICFRDVNLSMNFSTLRAVWQCCQANDIFTVECARRLGELHATTPVTITCLKLGVVKTNIRREFPEWMKWLVPLVLDPFLAQTRHQAAGAVVRLLCSDEFEGVTGALFSQIATFKRVVPGARVLDPAEGQRLWELSEGLATECLRSPAR